MFCDLAGSTVLSERLDPEELREVLSAYQAACGEVIDRFEGQIAQYLGDGLLVYFGYPQAHEDDAQRAARAGLGIVEAIKGLNERLHQDKGVRLAVRVGIHTGLVVVGEVGSGPKHEQLALGETPNLAARLQAIAEPDTIVVSAATHRLLSGLFACRDLGVHTPKGVSTPVQVYHVLDQGEAEGQSARERILTPLVGRDREMSLLLDRWDQASEEQGQAVLLNGEPGIGKSRLVQALKERIAQRPHVRLECRCSPYYQHTPLYPVVDLLPRVFGWSRDDSPDAKTTKLREGLNRFPGADLDAFPQLASLLSLPLGDRDSLPAMSPARQKQQTLQALRSVLFAMAAQAPTLLIVEDLHWIDPTTVEWLGLVLDELPTTRLLVLMTARPTFQAPWAARSHLTLLTLNRFNVKQTELMLSHVTGGKGLPDEVERQIVAKTDGVPLFVEELTKAVLESGLLRQRAEAYELCGPLPALAIPSTLRDSLMARLDRLATAKDIAQLGATLGRAFPYELLKAVSDRADAELEAALRRLVEAELLYPRGVPPRATYTFKHALVQEAAYESLLKSTRQQYHQRIAGVLAEQFPETAEMRPEFVAHHYTEAGLGRAAIGYWYQAGHRAIQRSAHVEAIAHLSKGLDLAKALPDDAERAHEELRFQMIIGVPLMSTKGYAAAEVKQAYGRARELCEQIGELPHLFPALRGLWVFYLVRADLQTSRELGLQLLRLAEQAGDRGLLVQAHFALGATLIWLGELEAARPHADHVLALYDFEADASQAMTFGLDPKVACLSYAARGLWLLGYPDQALAMAREAVAFARQIRHPFSMASALSFVGMLHQHRREVDAAAEIAAEVMKISKEQGFLLWLSYGTVLHAWALARRSSPGRAADQVRTAVQAFRATGARLALPYLLALLAEMLRIDGQHEEGLAVLTEALDTARRNGERWYEAEVHRLRGEALLELSEEDPTQATKALREALDVARRQSAKSLELRAVTSLSRLLQRLGKRDEARLMLGEICGWFTEGYDTLDLQEARALLEAL